MPGLPPPEIILWNPIEFKVVIQDFEILYEVPIQIMQG